MEGGRILWVMSAVPPHQPTHTVAHTWWTVRKSRRLSPSADTVAVPEKAHFSLRTPWKLPPDFFACTNCPVEVLRFTQVPDAVRYRLGRSPFPAATRARCVAARWTGSGEVVDV